MANYGLSGGQFVIKNADGIIIASGLLEDFQIIMTENLTEVVIKAGKYNTHDNEWHDAYVKYRNGVD